MEPQLPNPNSMESTPHFESSELSSVTPEKSFQQEVLKKGDVEKLGGLATHERPVVQPSGAPPSSVLPAVIPVVSTDPSSTVDSSAAPMLAADEDIIEKEWVDKAKKVIAQTKNDPYQKEREVSKLQADYLQKRYSRDVKVPEDA